MLNYQRVPSGVIKHGWLKKISHKWIMNVYELGGVLMGKYRGQIAWVCSARPQAVQLQTVSNGKIIWKLWSYIRGSCPLPCFSCLRLLRSCAIIMTHHIAHILARTFLKSTWHCLTWKTQSKTIQNLIEPHRTSWLIPQLQFRDPTLGQPLDGTPCDTEGADGLLALSGNAHSLCRFHLLKTEYWVEQVIQVIKILQPKFGDMFANFAVPETRAWAEHVAGI